MMTDSDAIDVADLPGHLHNPPPRSPQEQVEFVPMSVVERRHAAGVLAAMNGNKVQAARILGIHRATLARLLQEDGPAASARDAEEDAGVLPRSHRVG
jgi:DNA-binding NtrC family response regulator